MIKRLFRGLLSLSMLFSLTTNSFVLAEEENTSTEGASENGGVTEPTLQDKINALPTVDEYKAKGESEQAEIYDEAEAISDAFNLLTKEEQEEVDTTKLEDLLEYFNSLVAPTDDTVTLDLSKGHIIIKPTGYIQNGPTVSFTGTYIITGSFYSNKDTALSFWNDTDNDVTYNVIFDNAQIFPQENTYVYSSSTIEFANNKSKITLNISNKGVNKIVSPDHTVFKNQTSTSEVEVNITEEEGSSLKLDRSETTVGSNIIYTDIASFKVNENTISNTEAYKSGKYAVAEDVIFPSINKQIKKGGIYYVEGGTSSGSQVASINTSDKVTLIIDGDIICDNSNFLYINSSGEVEIKNESNYKIQTSDWGYFIWDNSENAKITVNGGEYIGENLIALAMIYSYKNTNLITLNNCKFQRDNTNYKYGVYAYNLKLINCTFETCQNAIGIKKSVLLDGTMTFTNNEAGDIQLINLDSKIDFGDTLEHTNPKLKVSLLTSLTEGEKRQITPNNTDIKYFDVLVPSNSNYMIDYDPTGKYFSIWKHSHDWTYALNSAGNSVIAKCSNEDCYYHKSPLTATVTATNAVYTGTGYDKASFVNNITKVTGAEVSDSITYEGTESTKYDASTVAPTDIGTYKASIKVGDLEAYANFAITEESKKEEDKSKSSTKTTTNTNQTSTYALVSTDTKNEDSEK